MNKRFARYLDEPADVYFKEDILTKVLAGNNAGNPQSSANNVIYTQGGGEENNE